MTERTWVPDPDEPLLHVMADSLPEGHPLIGRDVDCAACGHMVHCWNNEQMMPWIEATGEGRVEEARGNFCLACFAKADGYPWPAAYLAETVGPQQP